MESYKRIATVSSLMVALACAALPAISLYAEPNISLDVNTDAVNGNAGSVKGRVVDTRGQILPGAVVFVEDALTGAVSDVNGFYSIPELPVGAHEIFVSYVGYASLRIKVDVSAGRTTSLDIVLDEGIELDEVNVHAAFQGQRKAVNMQKNSMGISNVVSADEVGKYPDSNIGDALKRLPGINVQYDQGEARFGQIRGTGAELTSVTVNGNRLPSAEGDTRNVQLDLIPADMVQMIEVSKVVTADMDGDAIGGAINLVTKQSPYRRIFNVTAGTGFNWVSEKPQVTLGLTWGQRFANDKLGLMAAASYQYAPGGSDNTEFERVDDDGEVKLKEAQVRQYYVTRQRQSYSLSADYIFSPNHKIAFKGIYNRRHDWENRFRISYKKLDSKPSKQKVVLQTKGGSDDNRQTRLELQQTMDFSLSGEHSFGRLSADWMLSFARATEDRPEERYFGIAYEEPFSDSFLDVDSEQPYSNKAIPSLDADGWEIDEITNSNQEIKEEDFKARVDFSLPLAKGSFANSLKFGFKLANKDKQRETQCLSYEDAYESLYGDAWRTAAQSEIRNGFMPGSKYPIGTSFVSTDHIANIDFANMEGEHLLEEESGNYTASERITSGYLRFDQRFGSKLSAVLGLRVEATDLTYSGYNWIVDAEENESLVATGDVSNDYVNLLPSILLKYDASDALKLRLSFTETLSRPKYSALIPCVSYSVADEEAIIGNPGLNPTTSLNFDLGAEYYFKGVGLVGAGLFYKSVCDVIVDEVWVGESDEIALSKGAEYTITKTVNGYDADILGVECSLQRDFGFIAPSLKCLGVYGTYTYTHSKTRNHKFEHRDATDGIRMTGSPEHTCNASLFFDRNGFAARLSYNVASAFIDAMGATKQLDRYYDRAQHLDFNASYTFGSKCKTTIYADVTNLLNQPLRYYEGEERHTAQVEYYGVRADLGVKFNF